MSSADGAARFFSDCLRSYKFDSQTAGIQPDPFMLKQIQ